MITTTPDGRDWRLSAVCAEVDPEVFYPVDLRPDAPAVLVAKRVCAGCPVRTSCAVDVMAGEDPARRWGVTAGMTPQERTALYAATRTELGAVAA
ncbi:WhiB family transcriptional regulator [Pseudonocardia sp. GCM10023141]|uniref:WhiB family transcriptional regulator n=1 Tax=Pseudonocardia sp. GCM10023141 TaxID=3252653 RepID=UPI00360A44E0